MVIEVPNQLLFVSIDIWYLHAEKYFFVRSQHWKYARRLKCLSFSDTPLLVKHLRLRWNLSVIKTENVFICNKTNLQLYQ